VRLEGLGKLKKKSTSSGLEPVIFRLVAAMLPRAPFVSDNFLKSSVRGLLCKEFASAYMRATDYASVS
jgi:hypothetical protein